TGPGRRQVEHKAAGEHARLARLEEAFHRAAPVARLQPDRIHRLALQAHHPARLPVGRGQFEAQQAAACRVAGRPSGRGASCSGTTATGTRRPSGTTPAMAAATSPSSSTRQIAINPSWRPPGALRWLLRVVPPGSMPPLAARGARPAQRGRQLPAGDGADWGIPVVLDGCLARVVPTIGDSGHITKDKGGTAGPGPPFPGPSATLVRLLPRHAS